MRLETAGFLPATSYDFDRAVMLMGRVIDGKRQETVEVIEPAPKSLPKGQVSRQKPKYTMLDLLFDRPDVRDGVEDGGDVLADEMLSHLPTAML